MSETAATGDADTPRIAWGFGLATVTDSGSVLDTWYPEPRLGVPDPAVDPANPPEDLVALQVDDPARRITQQVRFTRIDLDAPPVDVPDVYLRLHLLSHRLVRPHGLNLDGVFGLLPSVVWTDRGPCAAEGFEATRQRLWARDPRGGRVRVTSVDKFPRMTDYVVPTGVRIGDADRIRLGAHLAPGTTVMHEGFVNFNAGTLGTSMVEGRVSAGVVVDDGSDVGGGSSIMGTLSGGGSHVISIGRRCLLGANAGIGISLGNDCIVEAGCYLTAGMKVLLLPEEKTVKARDLSGAEGLLFRRNSVTGRIEAVRREGVGVRLNPALHAVE
jgi:2,3,4,5-tetrahydropyridine-2,6-dicarboxylate N-succinyltransferase